MSINLKQLNQLLESIAKALDITDSHYELAVKRYDSVAAWLKRNDSCVASHNPEIYPQGSFLLGTVTKPSSDADEYDIDLVSELHFRKDRTTQKQLKSLIGKEIKAYADANNMNSPAEEGRRCWTLNYADDAQFHMDILPAIPNAESLDRRLESSSNSPSTWSHFAIVITDKKLPNYSHIDPDWPRSNPKGYAAWFRSRMETQFNSVRKSLAEFGQTQVEDVPEYKVKTPLQRAIQILKRHRDIMFAKDPDNKPSSIIITTLAGHAYNNESNLLDTLNNLVVGMPEYIEDRDGVIFIPNPVDLLENLADKWQENSQRKQNFYKWLHQVQHDLKKALELDDIQGVVEYLKPRLGARAVNEAMRNLTKAESRSVLPLAASSGTNPSRFYVPHRHAPKWPVVPKGFVKIKGWASRRGFRPFEIKSDSSPLPKHDSLRFEAHTSVPNPYKVYWQVVNTGNEARVANGLRGGFYESMIKKGRRIRKESTLYKGMHWIECFIIKDGTCWARSGEFIVNIQ